MLKMGFVQRVLGIDAALPALDLAPLGEDLSWYAHCYGVVARRYGARQDSGPDRINNSRGFSHDAHHRILNMKTRALSFSKLIVVTMVLGSAAGCAPESFSEESAPSDGTSQSTVSSLFALTPLDPVRAPVLSQLAKERAVIDVSASSTLELMSDQLRSGDTIGIDLGQLDGVALDHYRELIEGARSMGLSIVLENVQKDDMARLLDVGVDADAVLVSPLSGERRSEMSIYGGPADMVKLEHTKTDSASQKTALLDTYLAMSDEERAAMAAKMGMDAATLADLANEALAGKTPADPKDEPTSSTGLLLEPAHLTSNEIAVKIAEHLSATEHEAFKLSGTSQLPSSANWYYFMNMQPYSYTPPGATKKANLDVDFEVQLTASPQGKFLAVSSAGAGMTTGGLTWDSKGGAVKNGNRGWYQESAEITIQPTTNTSFVSNYKHAPLGDNTSGTFSSNTGCTWGLSGGLPDLSCSAANATSQTLTDFGVVDQSAGAKTSWKFRMMKSASGHPYNGPTDLANTTWGGLYDIPNLAKSTMTPEFQAIYRSDKSFTGSVNVGTTVTQQLRHVWSDGKLFVQRIYSAGYSVTSKNAVSVNFGKVK